MLDWCCQYQTEFDFALNWKVMDQTSLVVGLKLYGGAILVLDASLATFVTVGQISEYCIQHNNKHDCCQIRKKKKVYITGPVNTATMDKAPTRAEKIILVLWKRRTTRTREAFSRPTFATSSSQSLRSLHSAHVGLVYGRKISGVNLCFLEHITQINKMKKTDLSDVL